MRNLAHIVALFGTLTLFTAHSPPATAGVQQPTHKHTQTVQKIKPAAPKPKPVKVKVKPGDTLASIAKNTRTTYRRMFDANKVIKDPDLIYPGEKLRVPRPSEKLIDRPLPAAAPVSTKPVKAKAKQPRRITQPAAAPTANFSGSVWERLADCESSGDWSANTGNGFYGGLQFTLSSWEAVGGSGYPNQASESEQIARAQTLQSRQGWGAWPACSAKLGL